MNKFLPILILFLYSVNVAGNYPRYISPRPGSKLVSRTTNIIINDNREMNPLSLSENYISVRGSKSGVNRISIALSDDNKTILISPLNKFTEGETVTVEYTGGFITSSKQEVAPFVFSFEITPLKNPISLTEEQRKLFGGEYEYDNVAKNINKIPTSPADSLPADFPMITVNSITNPAPGYLFLSVSADAPGVGFYNFILDNRGNTVKYMKSNEHYTNCFQTQPNGMITYNQPHDTYPYAGGGHSTVRVLDTNLTVIDTFQCGNGYMSDSHEFVLLPNGHAVMVAYDLQPIDMSRIVTGGSPGALVYGSIIQELDLQKRVIFQWRSWDTIPITDTYQNMKLAGFDYIHVNALRTDNDGNFLVMARLTAEIFKLNRKTGEIMWRMGGKKNQFTFVNEHPENAPTYFTHPHGLTILPNGNFLFFDNGLLHSPAYSRAVEYKIDEATKTATMVWEYRHTPDIYAATQGSAQRLDNGNTLIGWGNASLVGSPAVTEVTPDKQVVFEMTMPLNTLSYRALKYPFRDFKAKADVSKQDIQPGAKIVFSDPLSSTGVSAYFQSIIGGYNYMNVKRYNRAPANMQYSGAHPVVYPIKAVVTQLGITTFTAELTFDSGYIPVNVNPSAITVMRRGTEGSGGFTPLTTTYNPVTKELSVITTAFGEFIFTLAQPVTIPLPPVTFAPKLNENVNSTLPVQFGFSGRGITSQYHILISTDSLFITLLVNDSTRTTGLFTLNTVNRGSRYFWKVRGKNEIGWSPWSEVKSFLASAPSLTLSSPNGGEVWKKRTAYFIAWSNNLAGDIKIELLRNSVVHSTIIQAAPNSGGYQWTIPDSIPIDSSYKIKLSSVGDSTAFDISDAVFTINSVTDISGERLLPERTELTGNYPNPFNPSTTISFSLSQTESVKLLIFDALGRQVRILNESSLPAGRYSVNWNGKDDLGQPVATGVYYCKQELGSGGNETRLSTKVLKLLLIK